MFREEELELGRRAIERNWITQAQMEECLPDVEEGRASLADVLVRRGLLQTAQVVEILREIHPPTRGLAEGETFGKYRIVREIGRGGMGAVYEALDPALGRRVALKVLTQRILPSHEDGERFLREARLAAKLRHPNLVAVHDVGFVDDIPFFTMDLIEGRTLDRVIEDPAVDRRARVEILRKTALAVHAAHRENVIHRDLKPGNIIVDAALEPHVTDFGLAKDLRSTTMLTQSGTAMGTPSYMAPEQAMGLRDAMDARTDVYSLGVVLYHALTGKLPFLEESLSAILLKMTTEEPEPLRKTDPAIDRALELVCLKAMARERPRRYAGADELADDLGRWLRGEPVRARPPGAVEVLSRSVRRHPAVAASGAVALFAAAAFVLFLRFRPAELRLVNPQGAAVEVDGVRRLELDFSLRKGRHRVRARKEGFRDFEREIELGPGQSATLELRLEPRAGEVSFEGLPPGTRVTLWEGAVAKEFETPCAPPVLREGIYRALCWAPGTSMVAADLVVRDRETTRADLDLPGALAWRVEAKDRIDREPVVGDLDGDGRPEIAFVSKDRHVRVVGARGELRWTYDTKQESHTDLVLAGSDLVFGTGTSGILSLRVAQGDLVTRWFHRTRNRAFATPLLPLREGFADLVATNWEGEVALLSGWKLAAHDAPAIWEKSVVARVEGAAGVGDEVVVATHAPEIVFFTIEGGEDAGRVALPSAPCSPLALADVNGDLAADAIVGLADGTVVCVSGRAKSVLWKWTSPQPARTRPLAADVDGDGLTDVVVGTDEGIVACLRGRDGTPVWRFRAGAQVRGTPALTDADGDGRPDVLFGVADGTLAAVDGRSGRLVWFYRAGGGITAGPVVAEPGILFASDDRHLYCVRARQPGK